MKKRVRGTVESGYGKASHWLTIFSNAYEVRFGLRFYPGTLNLTLDVPFDWEAAERGPDLIKLSPDETGGEREVLMYPCRLPELGDTEGFLWTTVGGKPRPDPRMAEFVASIGIRDRFGLLDGDVVTLELTPPLHDRKA